MTILNRFLSLMIAASAAASLAAAAAPVKYDCPSTVAVAEQPKAPDASWEAMLDSGRAGYPLDAVAVYSGHPREMASLVPDSSKKVKLHQITTWEFPEPDPRGIWMACMYGNSHAMLVRKVQADAKRCRFTELLFKGGGRERIESFVCE